VLLAWARPGAGPFRVPLAGGVRCRGGGADGVVEVPFRLAPDCDVVVLDRVPDA
jgi:alpha-galactosidase